MLTIHPPLQSSALRQPISLYVEQLALKYGVTYERSALDEYADAVTRLAGDDVHLDATECLLVALGRAKVITDIDMIRLMDAHQDDVELLGGV